MNEQGMWDERSKTFIKPSGTVKQGRRPMFCAHLHGYWINENGGQLRCYDCGFQANIKDLAPNKAREIEAWNP